MTATRVPLPQSCTTVEAREDETVVVISRPDHFHKLRSDTTQRQTTINSITVQKQKQNFVGFLGQNGLSHDGVVYAPSVRRLAENSWSEENLKSVVETPQKPRSMTKDDATDPRAVPEVHEQENPNEEANENDDESGETPDKPDDEDHEMEGETLPEPDTAAMSSSSRGETHRNTRKRVREKTVDG